jgi:hypothetical protein
VEALLDASWCNVALGTWDAVRSFLDEGLGVEVSWSVGLFDGTNESD